MGFWKDLLLGKNSGSSGGSFKNVDWLDAEHRWRTIETMAKTRAQADMRQALIQADVLIDTIMKQANVTGTTFGERLKALKTRLPHHVYQKLWQAHIKRNELVHEQGSFVAEWELTTHLQAFQSAMSAMRGLR